MLRRCISLVYTLRNIFAIAMLIASRGLRSWEAHVSSMVFTFWLLIIAFVVGGNRFPPHILVGAMLSSAFTGCMMSVVYDAYYTILKLRDMFLVSPLKPLELRLGISLGHLIPSTVAIVPYIIVLWLFVSTPMVIPMALLVMFVSWLIGGSLGYLIPCRDPLGASPRIRLVGELLVLLPPVYYPDTLIPENIRWLLIAIPTYDMAQIAKYMIGIVHEDTLKLFLMAIALIIESVLILVAAYIKQRECEEI